MEGKETLRVQAHSEISSPGKSSENDELTEWKTEKRTEVRTGEPQRKKALRADGGWDAQIHCRCMESVLRIEVQNDCSMHMFKSHLFRASGRNRRLLKKRVSSRIIDCPSLRGVLRKSSYTQFYKAQ